MDSQFLVFAGDFYYPGGGWDDFIGVFDSIEAARKGVPDKDWHQIVDANTLQIVDEGRKRW